MKGRIARTLVFLVALGIGAGVVFISRFDFVSDKELSILASTENELVPSTIWPAFLEPEGSDDNAYPDNQPTRTGVYFPINEKKFEKGFALVMDSSEQVSVGSIKIGDEFIEGDLSLIAPRTVVMTTKNKNGIRYEFRGKFIKNGSEESFESDEAVLVGTLTKYDAGRKVYTISSKYIYTPEVCGWREENQ